ncbi:MAG: plasmid partitioning protein RepB C-terminal domain-containing protein [Phaeospirillum sp.]|nr:plasmid partitioning protein RepB C-terminal domain-containing protein [Phaeospirillum sp.]
MTGIRLGFEAKTITLPLDRILPTKVVGKEVLKTPKFRTILASIRQVGLVEPLAVHPEKVKERSGPYILLDGHLRLAALREIGATEARCLVSTDDEGFTYNRRIARMTAIQEHRMLLQAIEKGVPPKAIAEGLAVDIKRIQERWHMLDGIAPEVADMLKDRMVVPAIFPILRRMKPLRQIDAVEMMISANRFTLSYAKVLLAATRPEHLTDPARPKKLEGMSATDIARMEHEMERLRRDYRSVEDSLGDIMLSLVVTKGYVAKLFRNEAVADYIDRHHAELAMEMRGILEAVGSDARTLGR